MLHTEPGPLKGILLAFEFALQAPAPGYQEELRLLKGLIGGEEGAGGDLDDVQPPPEFMTEALDYVRQRDEAAYEELLERERIEPGIEAEGALLGTVVERAVSWGYLLTRYRTQIATKLSKTYPQVSLFTPALVDFDLWLNDAAPLRTSIAQQVELYGLISEWSGGRFHGFLAFDPLRELQDPSGGGGTLATAKEAVQRHGFIGVKVYPPMGFRPLGNAELWPAGDPRRGLDEPLRRLYRWCQQERVPILAHCNDSNGAEQDFGVRAAPEHWARVLEEFGDLQVCLGHFGGVEGLSNDPTTSWAWQIGALMERYPFVYGDTSFHRVALDATDAERRAYLNGLARLFDAHPQARTRLVYGTDWQMILIAKGHSDYFGRYRREIQGRFGADVASDFTERNARRLLGLDSTGTGTRSRLERFYSRRSMSKPDWWSA